MRTAHCKLVLCGQLQTFVGSFVKSIFLTTLRAETSLESFYSWEQNNWRIMWFYTCITICRWTGVLLSRSEKMWRYALKHSVFNILPQNSEQLLLFPWPKSHKKIRSNLFTFFSIYLQFPYIYQNKLPCSKSVTERSCSTGGKSYQRK